MMTCNIVFFFNIQAYPFLVSFATKAGLKKILIHKKYAYFSMKFLQLYFAGNKTTSSCLFIPWRHTFKEG